MKPRTKSKKLNTKLNTKFNWKEYWKQFKFDVFTKQTYTIFTKDETKAFSSFTFNQAISVEKTIHKTKKQAKASYDDKNDPFYKDYHKFVDLYWDSVQPLTKLKLLGYSYYHGKAVKTILKSHKIKIS